MYVNFLPKCLVLTDIYRFLFCFPGCDQPWLNCMGLCLSHGMGNQKSKQEAGFLQEPRALFKVLFAIQKATLHTDDRHGYRLLQVALCCKYPLILVGYFFKKTVFSTEAYNLKSLQNIKYSQYLFSIHSMFIRKEDKKYSL